VRTAPAAVLVLLLAAAAAPEDSPPAVMAAPMGAHGRLAITAEPGDNWQHEFRTGLISRMTTVPQMAFWLEDPDGDFVATIFVTHKGATEDWGGAAGEIKRESALPVWYHKHRSAGVELMTLCMGCHGLRRSTDKAVKDKPELDAITGATPRDAFTRQWSVPERVPLGDYVVRAEINQSLDWNDTYRKDLPETSPDYGGEDASSGQPSVVYSGSITIGEVPASVALSAVGHGDPSGRTGVVFEDLDGLTTALSIVDSIGVAFTAP
jgi:hypothetical protein